MDNPTLQLIRQLNQKLSLLELENQRLKRDGMALQIQLKRCLKIIEALANLSSN